MPSTSREAPPSVPSGSQDWGRIHRPSSSTFSSPWAKTEDREKEEREREDRRREEDRERYVWLFFWDFSVHNSFACLR